MRAANLVDDADTTAAIAGQLAGATWGAAGIPPRWRSRVVGATRIESLARRLFAPGGGEPDTPRWPHDESIHAWWVAEGLLAGEYPGHVDPSRAAEKINLLVDAGIRTFVDLTTPADALEPYEATLAHSASCRPARPAAYSVPDTRLGVVDDDAYDGLLDALSVESRRGGVYVHCWGGVGRTGTVVGCWLGRDGATYDEGLRRLRQARAGTRKAHRPCPETAVQRALLERRFQVQP